MLNLDVENVSFSGNDTSLFCSNNRSQFLSLSNLRDLSGHTAVYLLYANIAVLIFTIIAGTIGNFLVFISMFMEERLVTCVNGLHGNLAMTDALNCMFGASLHLVRLFINPWSRTFSIITIAEEFLLYYNISASCFSTMALSFLKYWKLTHPLNKQPCKVIYFTMGTIQITSIIFGVTSLFERSGLLVACHKFFNTLDYPMWTILFIHIPLFILSLIVSISLRVASLVTLRKEELTIKKLMARIHAHQTAIRNDFTGAKGAFFVMIGVQCVCYLPFVVGYIWRSVYSLSNVAAETIVTCLMCSCAINPFVYTLRCHTYRKTIRRKMFGCTDGGQGSAEESRTDQSMRNPIKNSDIPMSKMADALARKIPNEDVLKLTHDDGLMLKVRVTPNNSKPLPTKSTNAFEKNCPCNAVVDVDLDQVAIFRNFID